MAADMTGIVVGVDASADSLRALRWAVDEAQIRGSDVTVLGAYEAIPVRAAWMPDTDCVELPVKYFFACRDCQDLVIGTLTSAA